MLMVILVVFFVTTLGATVIFSSHNALLMRQIERLGAQNFYSAEELMDQLRVGVQEVVSEAMSVAYKSVMADYSNILYNAEKDAGYSLTEVEKDRILQTEFSEQFCVELGAYYVGSTASVTGTPLINIIGDRNGILGGSYNPTVLKSFILYNTSTPEYTATVQATGDVDIIQNSTTGITQFILKGIELTYISGNYETNISTDISINTPSFAYLGTAASSGFTLGNYALVIRDKLTTKQYITGSASVSGDIYAGEIEIIQGNFFHDGVITEDGNFSRITSYLVTDEDGAGISITGAGTGFYTSGDTELWTTDLVVPDGATLKLEGDSYLSGDLVFAGNNNVYLGGNYFGFGNGDTAATSSSILFNGKGTTLTLASDLNLKMAGTSYLTVISGTTGSEVKLGQSMSALPDQIAYLIPYQAITNQSSNPVITSNTTLTASVNYNYELWDGKTISYYANSVQTISKLVGDSRIYYFFYNFISDAKRNEYFQDYIEHKGGEFTDNMKVYADISGSLSSSDMTAGNTYTMDSGDQLIVNKAMDDLSALDGQVSELKEDYRNLSQSMDKNTYKSQTPSGNLVTNPYDYMVNEDVLNMQFSNGTYVFNHQATSAGIEFKTTDGRVVGLVARSGLNMQNEDQYLDLSLLIAGVEATISTPFEGVMYAKDVVISADIRSSQVNLAEALQATATVTNMYDSSESLSFTLIDLFNDGVFNNLDSSSSSSLDESASYGWNLDALVTYSTWDKH